MSERAGLVISVIQASKISPTEHCLHQWAKKNGTISELWTSLEIMDRYDVIDDTLHEISKQKYLQQISKVHVFGTIKIVFFYSY